MTTLVAPPAKPAGNRGQVQVEVHDTVKNYILSGIGVDLKNGTTLQHDTSNVDGRVVVPGPAAQPEHPAPSRRPARTTTTT